MAVRITILADLKVDLAHPSIGIMIFRGVNLGCSYDDGVSQAHPEQHEAH